MRSKISCHVHNMLRMGLFCLITFLQIGTPYKVFSAEPVIIGSCERANLPNTEDIRPFLKEKSPQPVFVINDGVRLKENAGVGDSGFSSQPLRFGDILKVIEWGEDNFSEWLNVSTVIKNKEGKLQKGWVAGENLLCRTKPLPWDNQKIESKRRIILNPSYTELFSSSPNEGSGKVKQCSFIKVFVIAESTSQGMSLLSYSTPQNYYLHDLTRSARLLGWMDNSDMIDWPNEYSLQWPVRVDVNFKLFSENSMDTCEQADFVYGGQGYYLGCFGAPEWLPVLEFPKNMNDETFFQVLLVHPVIEKWYARVKDVQNLRYPDPEEDKKKPMFMVRISQDSLTKWIRLTSGLVNSIKRASNEGKVMATHISNFFTNYHIGGDIAITNSETYGEFFSKYAPSMYGRKLSPLLQYTPDDLKSMNNCEIKRIGDWIKGVNDVLSFVKRKPEEMLQFKIEKKEMCKKSLSEKKVVDRKVKRKIEDRLKKSEFVFSVEGISVVHPPVQKDFSYWRYDRTYNLPYKFLP